VQLHVVGIVVQEDLENFRRDKMPNLFQRYEDTFASLLEVLGLTKEPLKGRSEFNFNSGDPANLENSVAVLKVVEALHLEEALTTSRSFLPQKNAPAADIAREKNGKRVY
jgi:hypothetical protein